MSQIKSYLSAQWNTYYLCKAPNGYALTIWLDGEHNILGEFTSRKSAELYLKEYIRIDGMGA